MCVACMSPLARGLITQPSRGTEYGNSHLYAADIAQSNYHCRLRMEHVTDGLNLFCCQLGEISFFMAIAILWIPFTPAHYVMVT